MLTSILVTVLVAAASAQGALLESLSDISARQYDFIVVGAGPGGCAMASRLSENPNVNVLLIEAGPSNEGMLNTIIPFLGVTLANTLIDWNYTTVPQPGFNNRVLEATRGQVLGGTSSLNLMTWNRGSNDLWDRWASLTQDERWSWANIEQFYMKTSRLVPPADHHDTTGQVIPAAHGNGNVEISLGGFPYDTDERIINASKELGGRFGFNEDVNAGSMLGYTWMQSSIGNGKRSSGAVAYINPVQTRPNLDVLVNTFVTRVIQSGTTTSGGKKIPQFNTVEVATSRVPNSKRSTFTATREVILSAGVYGSPRILQSSGIGPKAVLQAKGIKTIVDNESVGRNFSDHAKVPTYYFVNSNKTNDALLRNASLIPALIAEWTATGQGLMVDTPANTQGFLRLPTDSSILKQFPDPSAGPNTPHMEQILVNFFANFGPITMPATGNFLTVVSVVVSPFSRGTVTIASSDPFAPPLIDPAYLSHEFDRFTLIQAMKDSQQFLTASPWKGFIAAPLGDLATATTDAKKLAYIQQFGSGFDHGSGTAMMTPFNANFGVVNPDLTVKGISGLRVVDASIFPITPSCHIQAVIYTVAEKAADMIKQQYGI